MQVVLCTPTRAKPHPAYLAAMAASVPALDAAGIKHSLATHIGSPYISYACADMLHRALATEADTFMFIEDDHSWRPDDLVKVLETDGDVVAGTYRFKHDDFREEYMGAWHVDGSNRPILRLRDGAIKAHMAPAGFIKITRNAVRRFWKAYPELQFGYPEKPALDIFNHGANVQPGDGRWWGQDYAFCKRWADAGGDLWIVPNLSINHHSWPTADFPEGQVWEGNLHEYLLRQPGGSLHMGDEYRSVA